MNLGTRLTSNVEALEPMLGGNDMTAGESLGSASLTELDQMIGRAEDACERHRRAVAERGLSPPTIARRLQALQRMEGTLARLRAQRHGKPKLIVLPMA